MRANFLLLIFTFISCAKTERTEERLEAVTSSNSDSLELTEITAPQARIHDPFKEKIDSIAADLADWGFSLDSETTLTNEYMSHWWLKVFQRKNLNASSYLPTESDYSTIQSIRQFVFKKSWKFYIEEWQFTNLKATQRWLQIALKTKNIDDVKPPRAFWVEGDKLFFVMATAAKDWFEHGDELVQLMSGKNVALLSLFNEPIDLVKYKKGTGANSATKQEMPYHHSPDTIGHHYNYFWFHHLRPNFRKESFRGLYIHTYIYGETIGTFEKVKEELIAIKSRLPDTRLKRLNFVGKTSANIVSNYGLMSKNEFLWARHNDDYLVLHLKNDTVDWFHYSRTNGSTSSNQLFPKELEYYTEKIPE